MKSDYVSCPITKTLVNKPERCPGQTCGNCDYSPRPVPTYETAHKRVARPKTNIPPKMSEHDRLMATQRCPEFIEDSKQFLILCERDGNRPTSDETKAFSDKMRRKWDIKGPCLYSDYVSGEGTPEIRVFGHAPFDLVSEEDWARIMQVADSTYGKRPLSGIPLWVTIGKTVYAQVAIDMNSSEKALKKHFCRAVKEWKIFAHISEEEQKQRKKESTYDKWEIYDLAQSGRKLTEIAELKSKKDYGGWNPAYSESYDKERWPLYKQVENAYNKAVQMIEAVKNAMIQRRSTPV